MIELVIAVAALVAVVVVYERARAAERDQWTAERTSLLNRIKPETAQPVPGLEVLDEPAVTWDNDKDFWSAKGVEVT